VTSVVGLNDNLVGHCVLTFDICFVLPTSAVCTVCLTFILVETLKTTKVDDDVASL